MKSVKYKVYGVMDKSIYGIESKLLRHIISRVDYPGYLRITPFIRDLIEYKIYEKR